MRVLSDLKQLISDIESVLRIDPPPATIRDHGGAVVTHGYLKARGISAFDFFDACRAAGFNIDLNVTGAYYVVSR
jgi:hypothetical protein